MEASRQIASGASVSQRRPSHDLGAAGPSSAFPSSAGAPSQRQLDTRSAEKTLDSLVEQFKLTAGSGVDEPAVRVFDEEMLNPSALTATVQGRLDTLEAKNKSGVTPVSLFREAALRIQIVHLKKIGGHQFTDKDLIEIFSDVDFLLLRAASCDLSTAPTFESCKIIASKLSHYFNPHQKKDATEKQLSAFEYHLLQHKVESLLDEHEKQKPNPDKYQNRQEAFTQLLADETLGAFEKQQLAYSYTTQLVYSVNVDDIHFNRYMSSGTLKKTDDEIKRKIFKLYMDQLSFLTNNNAHYLFEHAMLAKTYNTLLSATWRGVKHERREALLLPFALKLYDKSKTDIQKQNACRNLIIRHIEPRRFDDLDEMIESASDHTILSFFIRVSQDLDLSTNPVYRRRPYDKSPERAMECLRELYPCDEKSLREVDKLYEEMFQRADRDQPLIEIIASQMAVFYFANGHTDKANRLKAYSKLDESVLLALSDIAKNEDGKAIERLEALQKNKKRQSRIYSSLLGFLYERIADEITDQDEKTKTLHVAERYLHIQANTFKELKRSLARIQEKLGEYTAAHQSLTSFYQYICSQGVGDTDPLVLQVQVWMQDLADQLPTSGQDVQLEAESMPFHGKGKSRKRKRGGKRAPSEYKQKPTAPTVAVVPGSLPSPQVETVLVPKMGQMLTRQAEPTPEARAFSVPPMFEEKVVEGVMTITKKERVKLHRMIYQLYYFKSNYEEVIQALDIFLATQANSVLKANINQWKAWVLRLQAYDYYSLRQLAKEQKKTVTIIKAELRAKALSILENTVKDLAKEGWQATQLPDGWIENPEETLFSSDNLDVLLKEGAKRFCVQLASAVSSIGHIYDDDWYDSKDYKKRKEAIKPEDRHHDVAKRCYQCANIINPERQLPKQPTQGQPL